MGGLWGPGLLVGKQRERSDVNAFDRHVLTACCCLVPFSTVCEHIVDAGAVCVEVFKDIIRHCLSGKGAGLVRVRGTFPDDDVDDAVPPPQRSPGG